MKGYRPRISIVVPVYKVEKYIDTCIKSILKQTYPHFELILVDDGSPDTCGTICDNYAKKDKRIVVVHKKNGGLSDARNAGIDIATGEYITFIDSDDYVCDKYLEILLNAAVLYQADIVQGEETSNVKNLSKKQKKRNLIFRSGDSALRNHLVKHDIKDMSCIKLYKMELFDDIRFPVGQLNEDARTTYKLCWKANKVVCINNYIYFYRVNQAGIMHGKLSAEHFKMRKIPKEIEIYLGKSAPLYKKELSYYHMRTEIAIYNMYVAAGQDLEFEQEMKKIVKSLRKKHIGERGWDVKYIFLVNILRICPSLYKQLVLWARK